MDMGNYPTGGSGLGLAIVKKAIERMDGTVWAENATPKGLRITLRIPRVQE